MSLEVFEEHRRRLFGIAYRMLGTVADAEDVVQDVWLRWQQADRSHVRDAGAYLATATTRLAIDVLQSARRTRETYIGPWLPEPVSTAEDPLLGAERAEALSFAVLLLLERLTPAERAAYVLHEAFAYPYRRIAEVLETSEANARQLAARARSHLDSHRSAPVDPAERDRLLAAFIGAAQDGDLESLESVLAADVVTVSDSGGVVRAARRTVVGSGKVAHYLLGVLEKFASDLEFVPLELNGAPSMLGLRDGRPAAMWTADVAPDGIRGIYVVLNPSKLSRMEPLAGLH